MLEHRAHEVAHFDQRDLRQVVHPAHGVFAGIAGAGGDVQVAVGLGHVDALMDRSNVRGARERAHDAAGAQNRQAAQNSQSRIHGFQCQRFAVADVDGYFKPPGVIAITCQLQQVIGDHFARHRVDRRFSHGQYQTGPGDGAYALASHEDDARGGDQTHLRVQQRAMGHVRVVARVFQGARFGAPGQQATKLQAHCHHFALGQGDFNGVMAHAT